MTVIVCQAALVQNGIQVFLKTVWLGEKISHELNDLGDIRCHDLFIFGAALRFGHRATNENPKRLFQVERDKFTSILFVKTQLLVKLEQTES